LFACVKLYVILHFVFHFHFKGFTSFLLCLLPHMHTPILVRKTYF